MRMIEFEAHVIIGATHALFFWSFERFLVGIFGENKLANNKYGKAFEMRSMR